VIAAAVVALVVAFQEPTYDQGGERPWDTDIYPTPIAGGLLGTHTPSSSWDEVELEWRMSVGLFAPGRRSEARSRWTPHAALEPSMEALAERGDGRALLWLLAHRSGTPEERAAGRRRDFERLRVVADEVWTERGLLALAVEPPEGARVPLLSWSERSARVDRPPAVRQAALLARARLIRDEEPERADGFVLHAVRLFALGDDRRDHEEAPAELRELTRRCLDALARAVDEHARSEFVLARDGTRIPRLVPAPDPAVTWRPAVELLAARGVPAARLHLLRTTPLGADAGRALARAQLGALCASELAPAELDELAGYLDWLAIALGAEVVEPPVRALMARVGADDARALLAGLARGLHLVPDGHARGTALLRELAERWPDSDAGRRAAATLESAR
jgi:hypothetical protein